MKSSKVGLYLLVSIQYRNVTDGQTDRRMDMTPRDGIGRTMENVARQKSAMRGTMHRLPLPLDCHDAAAVQPNWVTSLGLVNSTRST